MNNTHSCFYNAFTRSCINCDNIPYDDYDEFLKICIRDRRNNIVLPCSGFFANEMHMWSESIKVAD